MGNYLSGSYYKRYNYKIAGEFTGNGGDLRGREA